MSTTGIAIQAKLVFLIFKKFCNYINFNNDP